MCRSIRLILGWVLLVGVDCFDLCVSRMRLREHVQECDAVIAIHALEAAPGTDAAGKSLGPPR